MFKEDCLNPFIPKVLFLNFLKTEILIFSGIS